MAWCAAAASVLLAAPLAAQNATVTIVAFNDSTVQATRAAEAGLVRFRFTNRSRDIQNMEVVAVADGHTAEEAERVLRAGRTTDWMVLAGGIGPLAPGLTASVSLLLPPGAYVLAGTLPGADGQPRYRSGMLTSVVVTGRSPQDDPAMAADGLLSISDIGFRMQRFIVRGGREQLLDARLSTQPTRPGERVFRVENAGRSVHEVVILRAETPQALRNWADGQPLPERSVALGGLSALPPGRRAWVQARLETGNYYLFCSIRHRSGVPGYQTGELVQLVVR